MSAPISFFVTSNAPEVAAYFDGVAARIVVLHGAAAMPVFAHTVKDIVDPLLADETPKDSGELVASQTAKTMMVPGGAEVVWESDSPHADYVIHGTGVYHTPDAHSAWDVNGLQVFSVNGQQVFAMHTHHEGQRPNDYPGRALERAQPFLATAMDAFAGKLLVSIVRG